jgi:hypothetical protein
MSKVEVAKRFLKLNFHDALLKGIHIQPARDRRSKSAVKVVLENYDAAVRPADDAGAVAAANALGGDDAVREHARSRSLDHAGSADNSFCQACPDHLVSRRRAFGLLAAIHLPRLDRDCLVFSVAGAFSQNDRDHGMNPETRKPPAPAGRVTLQMIFGVKTVHE